MRPRPASEHVPKKGKQSAKSSAEKKELLSSYRAKRRSGRTSEPLGGPMAVAPSSGQLCFIVHHHATRNTHFDLRLETDGE